MLGVRVSANVGRVCVETREVGEGGQEVMKTGMQECRGDQNTTKQNVCIYIYPPGSVVL